MALSAVVCKVCGCLDGPCLVSHEVPRQENVSTHRTVLALCGIAQGMVIADQGLLEMGKAGFGVVQMLHALGECIKQLQWPWAC